MPDSQLDLWGMMAAAKLATGTPVRKAAKEAARALAVIDTVREWTAAKRRRRDTFTSAELHDAVEHEHPGVSAGAAARLLRALRARGVLTYTDPRRNGGQYFIGWHLDVDGRER